MFTKEEFARFFKLVQMSGSADQMDRINCRIDMPVFIKEVGRDKCDLMWQAIESGATPAKLDKYVKGVS